MTFIMPADEDVYTFLEMFSDVFSYLKTETGMAGLIAYLEEKHGTKVEDQSYVR